MPSFSHRPEETMAPSAPASMAWRKPRSEGGLPSAPTTLPRISIPFASVRTRSVASPATPLASARAYFRSPPWAVTR